jgi:hypothetical protein
MGKAQRKSSWKHIDIGKQIIYEPKKAERNHAEKVLKESRFGREYRKKTRREAKRREKGRKIGNTERNQNNSIFLGEPITVSISISLRNILEIDEMRQVQINCAEKNPRNCSVHHGAKPREFLN